MRSRTRGAHNVVAEVVEVDVILHNASYSRREWPGRRRLLRWHRADEDLDVHWCYHVVREHERLYPTTDQRNYALTA